MKNTMKKFLSLVLAVLMLVSVVPMGASAANAYTINGKTVRYTDFSSSPDDCWSYANNIYNKIWGQRFSNSFSDSNNSLRNLSDNQLLLNATNLKNYVSHAALGSCLRICNDDYLHGTDGWGHSQIIVQKDSNGFTVFEGGLTASPHIREKYYTWSEYCNTNWLGGTYKYIKYIKWPGASAYSATVPEPTTILYPTSGATYKIASGVGNNMYLDFACSSDNVQIYENCDGHSNPDFVKSQYFKLTHVGDGWYTVVNVGNGKAMDVDNWTPDPTTNVHQYDLHSGDNQLFRFYDAGNGYCYIKSKLGCYLDVQNGDSVNNTNVWMYTFNESTAQKWKLEKKDAPETDTQKPSISNVKVTELDSSGFTISCNVSDNVGIKQVLFPVWTTESLSSTSRPEAGQDDIVYHEATINGNTVTCRINIADHNNSYGEYVCDPHVYDTSDNCLISSRIYIQVPKIVAKNEQLAPLGVYNLSENNTIGISGWAFNLTGERVDCYYQFDNDEETKFENANRPDVYEFHEGCKQIDCGYGGNISILDLSEGKHTVRIIAKTGNASQILFSNEFTVIVPTFTIYFNANSGQCSTASKSVKFNSSYGSLPTPTRNGHTFDGWYTSAIDGTKVTSSTKVTTTGDLTLYAHWTCNHSTTEIRNNVTATCTAEGYTGDTYCKACGTKIKAGDIIVKTPHNSNITIPAVSATCTKTGLTEGKKCSVCGIVTVAQTTVSKLSHTYTSKITTQATHLTEGIKTFTCKCGDSYTESVAKLPEHTYTSELTKEATHLEEGETTYTCACGDTYTEAIAKLTGHTYEEAVTAPTCTAKGYTTYTCECGDTYVDDYTNKLDHEYASVITTPTTHLSEGVRTYTCNACGDSYTEAIAKTKEHSYFVQNIVEPTCESEGYTTYMCECGHNYNGDKKAATGHNYNGDKCADCGESKIENYCSCNCHKSGFMGFIWKILRFFYKLFGTNKTCDCGAAHY